MNFLPSFLHEPVTAAQVEQRFRLERIALRVGIALAIIMLSLIAGWGIAEFGNL